MANSPPFWIGQNPWGDSLTPAGRAFGHVAEAIQRWGAELVGDEPGPAGKRRARR